MSPEPAYQPPHVDWGLRARELDAAGFSVLPALLSVDECAALRDSYEAPARFRSRVVMARHGFGRGEYQYFSYPLPPLLQALRSALYPPLAAIANRWSEQLRRDTRYPPEHAAYLARCHEAGQLRPTPLLLRYGPHDYNCLHQDLYGPHVFPLQLTVLLSKPGEEFEGGEFVLTAGDADERRAEVVPLAQGDAVVFAVNERPVPGRRGMRRAVTRHGVSVVRSGRRFTVGLIFHDAP